MDSGFSSEVSNFQMYKIKVVSVIGSSFSLLAVFFTTLKCMLEFYASGNRTQVMRSILDVYSSYYKN